MNDTLARDHKFWLPTAFLLSPNQIRALLFCPLMICVSTVSYADNSPASPPDLTTLQTKAEKGDTEAQAEFCHLAPSIDLRAASGSKAAPQHWAETAKWCKQLAKTGDPIAQLNLGSLYFNGFGVSRDYMEAATWLRKAAEQGNAGAQISLATLYDSGLGVKRDIVEGFKWSRKAAEQGMPRALYNLGFRYEHAGGVTQDYAEAYFWYSLAASTKQNPLHADRHAADMAAKLTPEQKDAIEQRVKAWRPTVAQPTKTP